MTDIYSGATSGSLAIDMYHELTRKYSTPKDTNSGMQKDMLTQLVENNSARVESIKMRNSRSIRSLR